MRLWWVRHGPTHSRSMTGWTDLPADLSDHAALARLDAHLPRDAALVSSDLRRAVATADALAAGRRRLPHEPGLREIHFGTWEGRGFAEVEAETPDLIRAFWDSPGTVAPPGGESWNRLAARVQGATDRLVAAGAAGDLVIVAHFGAILAALQRAAGLSAAAVLAQRIEPLSVTRIDRHPDGWQVGAINHLP